MERRLDRKVALLEGNYGFNHWCLHEIEQDGRMVDGHFIPWDGNLHFEVTQISLLTVMEFRGPFSIGAGPRPASFCSKTHINCVLRPAKQTDPSDRPPSYSMFGTDRLITDFRMRVSEIEDGNPEVFSCDGEVSYFHEENFIERIVDDRIVFDLGISSSLFCNYASKIENGFISIAGLVIMGAAGFYAESTPSTQADRIKVLTCTDHFVDVPPRLEVKVPRCGEENGAQRFKHYFQKDHTLIALNSGRPNEEQSDTDETDFASANEALERNYQDPYASTRTSEPLRRSVSSGPSVRAWTGLNLHELGQILRNVTLTLGLLYIIKYLYNLIFR